MIGFFNCIKPVDFTSNDVVMKIKKALNRRDVGHLGTLDPLAVGVLPIAVGKATRLFDYLINEKKTYIAKFLFGVSTDTLDITGKTLEENKKKVTEEQILNVLPNFIGEIKQAPPAYSAIKIKGKRAYDLARAGIEVKIPERIVNVYNITLLSVEAGKYVTLEITCGGGTYIRSLGRDIAAKTNNICTMASLERTLSSGFYLENATSLDDIITNPAEHIIPLEKVLEKFQRFDIPIEYDKKIKNGVPIDASVFDFKFDRIFAIFIDSKIFGLGHIVDGKIRIKTNLYTGE